ncbi:MAG: hypothetical protein KA191_13120 [Verrucomicrobia bacterium]|jgi:hypothetical protein|nr:hypothetical protein [Verrucomicrobiota bacterium]HQI31565.1 hypothetical protein [Verrucomicrobiota bacterium]HRD03266.1 hypothetical protein [Verrucomicrobiota bacterium]
MTQQFNPKRVLRQISNPLLKAFFERQGHPLDVDWDRLANTQVDDIFDGWQRLPADQRKAVEVILQDVHEMANEDGTRVIIEEGQYHSEDLTPLLEPMESRYDKALWTFMNRPAIWDAAVRFAKADILWGGRSWMKRGNMPSADPKTDPASIHAFQGAMSAFYRDRQGRGHHCKVEYFPRGSDHHYFFVYLSDYADTYINFDDSGHFQRTPERRAFEVVFAYERSSSTLEMYAKGGKQVVASLQHLFSTIILGESLEPEEPGAQPYELNGLMDRSFAFPTDPEDGIEDVTVRAMRLSILGRKRGRITLEPDPNDGRERIYEMLEEDLNRRCLPRSILHVTKATMNFRLNGNGHGRSLTFSVTFPNGCDLKNKREDQRLLGEKYLKRWKIDVT